MDEPLASQAANGTSPTPATVREFEVEELGKKDRRWRLAIRPGDMALFEEDDPQPYVILREQMQKDVMLLESLGALAISKPRKLTFKLPPPAVKAVADWTGASILARAYLKRRYTWVLPVAILWILGSLPVPGNPEAGVEPVALDVIGLCLGVALVVAWAFAKWRPHPTLFLVDSVWFLCLAGYLTWEVFNGRSKLWLILVGLLIWMVITGLKCFRRFRATPIQASPA